MTGEGVGLHRWGKASPLKGVSYRVVRMGLARKGEAMR